MTIVLADQSCASLADRLRGLAPVFVFQRSAGGPATPDVTVTELREALQRSGVRGPYVIVAASFAGFTALLYADRYPDDVAGLVLVDSSHPQQSDMTMAALPTGEHENPETAEFRKFLRGFGPIWEQSCQMLARLGPLGELPLIALAAEAPPMPESLPLPLRTRLVEIWHSLQQDHARRSARGELRIVKGAGHAIAQDVPHAVVAAIEGLVKVAGKSDLD